MPDAVFKGKEYVCNRHLMVRWRPLVADATKCIGAADLVGNLVIHGDKLNAPESRLPRYAGKVDLVFSTRRTTPATRAGAPATA